MHQRIIAQCLRVRLRPTGMNVLVGLEAITVVIMLMFSSDHKQYLF